MAFTFQGRSIRKIGVVGSGQIGPDIALYFTKVFHAHGVPTVVVDIAQDALDKGRAKLHKKIDKGQESGAFPPAMAEAMKTHVSFTSDYAQLADADLVVEAASEDKRIKRKIFSLLEAQCGPEALLCSNSSHMEPEEIFAEARHKHRAAVVHYFFPAERNIMVEVVPGRDTAPATTQWLMDFYEAIGKCPIRVGSRYGYAIDPIFEGIFVAACKLVEAGLGTTKEIDAVAQRALGLGVGPFTAMNLTGGNPITMHGCETYTTLIMPWFAAPDLVKRQVELNAPWEVPGRDGVPPIPAAREQAITHYFLGAYFGLVCEVLDSGISNIADLEMGLEQALVIHPPFSKMNEIGIDRSLELVQDYADAFPGFKIPHSLEHQANHIGDDWNVPVIQEWQDGDIAVIKLRRPKVLNALNKEAFLQIQAAFNRIRYNDSVKAAVFTAFGVKAFISGADVNFLAKIETSEQGEATSWESQQSLLAIENCGKPVICAMNGFAFGGGMELAMACTARLCRRDLHPLGGQPETNLGIIPGAGATQRLPRWIGVERAAELLRTGRPFTSLEAVNWGLVREEVDGNLVTAAVTLARQAASGKIKLLALEKGPIPAPAALPAIEIGHRSRAVDAILCRAILEGCKLPLEDGLRFESKMFGAVCGTRDMRIGVDNFIQNGPKAKAAFVHA